MDDFTLLDFPFALTPIEGAKCVEVRRNLDGVITKAMPVMTEVFDTDNPLDIAGRCMDAEMVEAAAKIANKSKAFFADCPPPEVAVYVLAPESNVAAKIGVANNPTSRLASLQTAHFEKLSLRALFWCQNQTDAFALECQAHKDLARHAERRSEWFATDPVTAVISVAETALKSGLRIASSEMWMRHRQMVRRQLKYFHEGEEPGEELRVVA